MGEHENDGCSHHGEQDTGHGHGQGGADPNTVSMMQSQHACFIVGTQALFLVHMANSWIDCHRYQMVLRITIPDDVKQRFLDDRKRHPGEWYIIGNLAENLLSLPDIKRGAVRSFQASLWRGWPANEGSPSWPWADTPPVISTFEVTIDRVVWFRRFDFNEDWPRTAGYVLFGEGDEAHINHSPIKQPDFDHVASLAVAPAWLPKPLLEAGVPINFPTIPAVPGGASCREAVHTSNPIADGTHSVQYGGFGPGRPIEVARTVFFGTWPFNRTDPGGTAPWDPCAPPD